jgi:hypothetical protein
LIRFTQRYKKFNCKVKGGLRIDLSNQYEYSLALMLELSNFVQFGKASCELLLFFFFKKTAKRVPAAGIAIIENARAIRSS